MFSGRHLEQESNSDFEVDDFWAVSCDGSDEDEERGNDSNTDEIESGGEDSDDDMSVWTIPFVDSAFRGIKKIAYDSTIDRLNYYWTTRLLLFVTMFVAGKQLIGKPLQCMCPAHWPGGWCEYVEDLCFIENTFAIGRHDRIPRTDAMRNQYEISYYQWVPIVLALQAALFYAPNIFWKAFQWRTGFRLDDIVTRAQAAQKGGLVDRVLMNDLSILFECSLGTVSRGMRVSAQGLVWRKLARYGCWTTLCYITTKVLYLANSFGQLVLLNYFLGRKIDRSFWGAHILNELFSGEPYGHSPVFPHVTVCDIEQRRINAQHEYGVQCVLSINMYNEKIFLLLWWWLVVLTALNAIELIKALIENGLGNRIDEIGSYFDFDFMPVFLRTENDDDDDIDSYDLPKKRSAELDRQHGAAVRMSNHLPLDYVPQMPPAADGCDSGAGTMERGPKKPLRRQYADSETETHVMEQGEHAPNTEPSTTVEVADDSRRASAVTELCKDTDTVTTGGDEKRVEKKKVKKDNKKKRSNVRFMQMTRHTLEPVHMDKPAQIIIDVDRDVLKTFVRDVLSYDGVLALRIVAVNAGLVAASEIVRRLYVKHEAFDWQREANFVRLFGVHPKDVVRIERGFNEVSDDDMKKEHFARKNKRAAFSASKKGAWKRQQPSAHRPNGLFGWMRSKRGYDEEANAPYERFVGAPVVLEPAHLHHQHQPSPSYVDMTRSMEC